MNVSFMGSRASYKQKLFSETIINKIFEQNFTFYFY